MSLVAPQPSALVATITVTEPTTALVPAKEHLPATVGDVLTKVVDHNDRFLALLETRGAKPEPRGRLGRVLNSRKLWIPIIGASAALTTSPLLLASTGGGLTAMGCATALSMLVSFLNGLDLRESTPTPLSLLTRSHKLTVKDLAFLGDTSAMSPLERATLSIVASEWLRRIDNQLVVGDGAYLAIEKLVKDAEQLPRSVHDDATKLLALNDAVRDPKTGAHRRTLDAGQVTTIIAALEALPGSERQAIAEQLLQVFYKDDAPRFRTSSNANSRTLYRALVAASRGEATANA